MGNFLKDFKFPGSKYLPWILAILIFAPTIMIFSSGDSKVLNTILKILAVVFDAVCIYITYWIVKRGAFREYSQIVLVASVLAIGETIMAFL